MTTAVEKEISRLRTCKFFDWKCDLDQTCYEKMISGEPLVVNRMHRCCSRIAVARSCHRCGQVFSYWMPRIRVSRDSNNGIHVGRACCSSYSDSFQIGFNTVYVDEPHCEACLHFYRNDLTKRPLPYQTNHAWLPFLPPLFLKDLAGIIADYDGYDPASPPIKRCIVCHKTNL